MTKIIGLTGYKQSGKSTAAKYIAENYGYVRVNFKDALVQEIKDNFPDLLEEMVNTHLIESVDDLFQQKPPLMRALMQNYGTEVRRNDDPKYWVKKWIKEMQEHESVVTDDVRFLNEAHAVTANGGKIIHIERTDITTGGNHLSETEQDMIVCHYNVTTEFNNLEDMYEQIDNIIAQM